MLLIPRPIDVDAVIRKVRKGRLITVSQICAKLAEDFNAIPQTTRRRLTCYQDRDKTDTSKASTACPLCTGIFVRIAAEAAEGE